MGNKPKLSEMMLGIILIITIIPAKAQITKLFPVTDILLKTPEPIIQETFNEPYSEKVVYPPPPGIKVSTTSSTESTLSILGDLTIITKGVHSGTTSKPVVSKDKETSPNDPNLSRISSVPTIEEIFPNEPNQSSAEGTTVRQVIQFQQETIQPDLPLTTQGPLITESATSFSLSDLIQINRNSPAQTIEKVSSNSNSPIEESEGIVDRKTNPLPIIDLSTEGPFTTDSTNFRKTTTPNEENPINTITTIGPEIVTSTTQIPTVKIKTTPSIVSELNPNSEQCTTPIGKHGECKDIRQCPSLVKLLMREPLLVENKLYLQRSQCGIDNQTVLACCPDNVPEPIISPKWSLLPKPRMCGSMHENRLYGGYYTEIDSYSWMALLEYNKGGKETGFHCGGTLISDRYILTAAHCVTGLPKTWSIKSVRLGEWDLDNTMDCSKYIDFLDCADPHINVAIDEVIPHKDYMPTSKNHLHDIALIRLANQVNFTDFIEPICLPHDENNLHAFDEQTLDMVGWGASSEGIFNKIKEKSSAQVIPLNKCRHNYAQNNITLEQSQFCVEGRVKNDTCRSDSGGSVISFDTSNNGLGSYYIGGIQSFGSAPCWADGLPAVYTRVGEYLDWILDNIHI